MKKYVILAIYTSVIFTCIFILNSCSENAKGISQETGLAKNYNENRFSGKEITNITDSCVKTKFSWKDSKGNEFPVYMNSGGSCFIIRTSKSGEDYRAYLGKEVSEQICRELKMKNIRNN